MTGRVSLRRLARLLSLALLLLPSSTVFAAVDPCAFGGTLQDLFNNGAGSPRQAVAGAGLQAAAAADAESLKAELLNRANGDGLAGGRVDLLRRAFVAFGLGEVSEENKDLIFNFNPDFLSLSSGQLSPRVIVHETVLYGALDERIDTFPEGTRADRKDALKAELRDLDDVELKIRWTNTSGGTKAALQPIVNELFEEGYKTAGGEASDDELGKLLNEVTTVLLQKLSKEEVKKISVVRICQVPEAKAVLVKNFAEIEVRIAKDIETLRTALDESRFFALADLIEGQPKLIVDGSFRRREGPAGPNESSLSLTYQVSSVSYNDAQRWAKGELTAAGARQYLQAKGRLKDSLPLFSLSAQYTKTNEFRIAIPSVAEEFLAPGSHLFTGKITAGAYFGGGRDRRLDLEATYDDVRDDPTKKDRFLAKLSWTEKLNGEIAKLAGGSDFVVTLIYANKPEFRGEVNEDFGLRAGLKWALGGS